MRLVLFIFALFFSNLTQSQTYFKTALNKADPVVNKTQSTTSEKIKIHKIFLQKAISNQNKTNELYGYLYLLADYFDSSNYVMTSNYYLKAEILVTKHKNPSWEAALNLKKVLILAIKNDPKGKLNQLQKAYQKSKVAKDSIYMGESLEQMSATYGEMDQYEKAEYYFQLALPLIKKFDTKQYLGIAYNNYSNLKSYEGQPTKALAYINSAITITQETNDPYTGMMYRLNKGAVLKELKLFKDAETLLKACEKTNVKNDWKERLTHNYIGLADLYENWGKYAQSLEYYKKYYQEKEKLNGQKVKLKIADLEHQNLKTKREIELKDNQISIIKYKRKIDQLVLVTIIILLALLGTLYFWKKQKKQTKAEFEEKLSDLKKLTHLLISKNNVLLDQKNTTTETKTDERVNEYDNLLIKKILTDSDWLSFKTYFEKAYPNFINRIRSTYPQITAAEERLFLCLKLNLNNKEVASILGISNEGVKKSRNRLRKRIDLNAAEKLNDYVRNF